MNRSFVSMQSSQLDLHAPTSKKALPPPGQIRMVNFGIQWRGKWQRYPCCISSRPWAWLPKLPLHPSRVKDVHNSRLRLGFQNRYCLSNEYSTTGRHIFPMIRIRERRECLSKLLTTSAKQRLSQSTSNLVDRTWPLKPSFLFLATRRSWWWHNCIAPIWESTVRSTPGVQRSGWEGSGGYRKVSNKVIFSDDEQFELVGWLCVHDCKSDTNCVATNGVCARVCVCVCVCVCVYVSFYHLILYLSFKMLTSNFTIESCGKLLSNPMLCLDHSKDSCGS